MVAMRLVLGLIGASLVLTGCTSLDKSDTPASISLLFPADEATDAAAKAEVQCKFYSRTAKLQGTDARGITYDCE